MDGRLKELEEELEKVKRERDEAVDKDLLVARALEDLKKIKNKKKIIDAALEVAKEFEGGDEISGSIRKLIEACK